MYFEKDKFSINYDRNKTEIACLDMLVPQNHLVRKVEAVLDLSFVYDLTRDLYCHNNGRKNIDTVILFKIVILNFLFGNNSIRKTCEEAKVNLAYRWYLGIGISDPIPNYSTFSQNYIRKFAGTDIFEQFFSKVLETLFKYNVIDPSVIFVDGTHIKANANKKKFVKQTIKITTDKYQKALLDEVNEFRDMNGRDKYPSDDDNDEGDGNYTIDDETGEIKEKENSSSKVINISTTDPDCGMFVKGEHEKQFAYVDQVACDINGWVLAYDVNPGNMHDSKAFLPFFENKLLAFNPVTVCADAGYSTPLCAYTVQKHNCNLLVPYVAPKGIKNEFGKKLFDYIDDIDNYMCPNGKLLEPWNISKEGQIQYKIHKSECGNCKFKEVCIKNYSFKTITRHMYDDCMLLAKNYRLSEEGKYLYKLRKENIERVFAECKESHGLRITRFKGLKKNSDIRAFLYACKNLKKLALLRFPTKEVLKKRTKMKKEKGNNNSFSLLFKIVSKKTAKIKELWKKLSTILFLTFKFLSLSSL